MKEILTPREAAEYLSVHVRTIYRLVKQGEIPSRKVGGSWRFKKGVLDEWLSGQEKPFSEEKE
jgi:excisionase family DNA binding protein